MKTIKARARAYAQTRNQNTYAYDGYLKGAIEQQALDNVQLCEMVLDNQNAIIDKACEAFKTTCKEHAGLCDREWLCDGCNKYEHFRKAMKGE